MSAAGLWLFWVALVLILPLFKLRVWDMRQPNPAANIAVNERIYAMDAKQQAVVLATADKQVHVFDITGTGGMLFAL